MRDPAVAVYPFDIVLYNHPSGPSLLSAIVYHTRIISILFTSLHSDIDTCRSQYIRMAFGIVLKL